MQTGVCTDHCNYGALRESSFLCRFICHINKGISSTYGGWWQQEKFEKINELWQCCTWGEKSVAISSGLCWHRVCGMKEEDGERPVIVADCDHTSFSSAILSFFGDLCLWSLTLYMPMILWTKDVPVHLKISWKQEHGYKNNFISARMNACLNRKNNDKDIN